MNLSEQQIDFIRNDIRQKGVSMDELAESLVDHICCYIESGDHAEFYFAYAEAMAKFGTFGPKEIQENTIYIINLKKEMTMKRTMYILGYFAAILVSSGLLFKVMHWPSANIMIVLGIALLNFGYLPLFFYKKYKQSVVV